jgi:TetR/AcrR family transcriptional regulator, cholesterol catabolism regulator
MQGVDQSRTQSAGTGLDEAAVALALADPQMGQAKAAQALQARGYSISPSGVRYIWRKHGLETIYKRLKAIEKSSGAPPLTERQRERLQRGDTSRRLSRQTRAQAKANEATPPDRRGIILEAAAQLFVERGYGGTSMRDIAARAGLLPGSVYHHYAAKEDLFLAVHREGFRRLITRVEQAIARSGDPWQRLERACAEHIGAMVEGDAISRIAATGLFAIHEQALQHHMQADHDRYEAMFRKLIEALDLAPGVDRSLFRLSLLGAMNWTLVWFQPGRKSPGELATHMVALLRDPTTQPSKDSSP